MDNQPSSTTHSEQMALLNDGTAQEERTTLTGKPIKYEHDNLSNMMLGDGGGFAAPGVGANLLPPGYTDKSRVRIPIKMSDVEDAPASKSDVKHEKKTGLFGKLSSKRREKNEDIVVVMMSRGEYLKYWASPEHGKFLESVVEPPEGRKEWLRRQLELNEEMKRNDPSLGKPAHSYSEPGDLFAAGAQGLSSVG